MSFYYGTKEYQNYQDLVNDLGISLGGYTPKRQTQPSAATMGTGNFGLSSTQIALLAGATGVVLGAAGTSLLQGRVKMKKRRTKRKTKRRMRRRYR